MSLSDERNRHARSAHRTVARRVGTAVLGAALLAYGLFLTIGTVRTLLEPETRVQLHCGLARDRTCPASWTLDRQVVHGTADDPYSAHRYSRFIDHPANATLTMHVSGKQATMTPATSAVLTSLLLVVMGSGMLVGPFVRRKGQRQMTLGVFGNRALYRSRSAAQRHGNGSPDTGGRQ